MNVLGKQAGWLSNVCKPKSWVNHEERQACNLKCTYFHCNGVCSVCEIFKPGRMVKAKSIKNYKMNNCHGQPRHGKILLFNKTHVTAIDCSRFAEAQRLDTHDGPE